MMAGARREWLGSNDFVMIHLDLIDLGLSWEAAGLLHRIHFRSGGEGWWTVTKAEMQADARLTERKLDRAIEELRAHEMVEWERQVAQNPTLSWRVVYDEVGEPTNRPSREPQNVPQQKDETSRSSTKNGKNNNTSSADADARSAAFEKWWSYYPRKVAKIAARKAFDKALKDGAKMTDLGPGLERAILYWRTEETPLSKIPHPATWLNEGRWADEHPDAAPAVGTPNGEDEGSWMHRTE